MKRNLIKISTLSILLLVTPWLSAQVTKRKGSIFNKAKEAVKTATGASVPLTESEIAEGLKEALKVGSNNASNQLSALDGFNKNSLIRIPFPKDAQIVADKLRQMGFGKKVDEFELTLNRAAEKASKDAANIFVNAITSMTITDAKNILQGSNNAATTYLKTKTSDQLKAAFRPHIETALNSTYATSKWKELTSLYNKIPMVKPVNTDLVGYTNDKAIFGMFTVVEQEETKIRQDPAARVNDILKKVFGNKN